MHIRAVKMKFSRYHSTGIYALIFSYSRVYVTGLVGNNYGRKQIICDKNFPLFNPSSILTKTP